MKYIYKNVIVYIYIYQRCCVVQKKVIMHKNCFRVSWVVAFLVGTSIIVHSAHEDSPQHDISVFGHANSLRSISDTTNVGTSSHIIDSTQISAFGQENEIRHSSNITAIGHELLVTDSTRVVMLGDNNIANKTQYSTLVGSGLMANFNNNDSLIIGSYNQQPATPGAVLVVGNGTGEESRSNKFVLYGDGTVNLTNWKDRIDRMHQDHTRSVAIQMHHTQQISLLQFDTNDVRLTVGQIANVTTTLNKTLHGKLAEEERRSTKAYMELRSGTMNNTQKIQELRKDIHDQLRSINIVNETLGSKLTKGYRDLRSYTINNTQQIHELQRNVYSKLDVVESNQTHLVESMRVDVAMAKSLLLDRIANVTSKLNKRLELDTANNTQRVQKLRNYTNDELDAMGEQINLLKTYIDQAIVAQQADMARLSTKFYELQHRIFVLNSSYPTNNSCSCFNMRNIYRQHCCPSSNQFG